MNAQNTRAISIGALIIFLILFGLYFINNSESFSILLDINPLLLLLVALGHTAIIVINGVLIKRILKPFNIFITARDSLYVSYISSLGNFFLPMQSGAGLRAVYLKEKYELAYNDFITILSGNYVVMFFVNSLFGLISIIIIGDRAGTKEFVVIGLTFLAIFTATLLIAFTNIVNKHMDLFLKILPWQRLKKSASRIKESWNMIIKDLSLVRDLLLLTIGSILVNLVIIQSELSSLELSANFWSLVLFATLGSVVLILNITPASLGIKEAILIFSAAALGLSIPEILSLAIIDRSIKLLVLSVGWLSLHTTKNNIVSESVK